MGLFDRITKRGTSKAGSKAPVKEERASKKAAPAKETDLVTPVVSAGAASRLLIVPRVSEKSATLASNGTYVFNVPLSANKVEIRKAVEAMYKVNVTSIRTVRVMGKRVLRGRIAGQRSNWKKALVTLKAGQKIELHERV